MENQILHSINRIIEQFQKNPYQFLFESDIQCALFAELRKNIPEKFRIPSVTKEGLEYELELVYSEYRNKIDLVCLDLQRISFVNKQSHNGDDTYIYELPLLVGIELKYVIMGYLKVKDVISVVHADYQKLLKLDDIQHRLAICFLQNDNGKKTTRFYESMQPSDSPQSVQRIEKLDGKYVISPLSGIWQLK